MSTARYSSPFPPLNLTAEAKAELQQVADLFVAEAIDEYESYLHHDCRQIDLKRWKLYKQREDLRAYVERKSYKTRHKLPSNASSETIEDIDALDAHAPPPPNDMPVMLTVGTLAGDLFDVMYGTINPTLDQMRIKTFYVHDAVVDCAVLETMQMPTPEDPFRSLMVKWAIKGQALHIRTVVKNRDLLFLESNGLARLASTGETIGYHILHSVTFPHTQSVPGCQRGNISICAIFRQHEAGVVEVHTKGFSDPKGRIVEAAVVKSVTDYMLSVNHNLVCAQHKKLAYALRRRHNPAILNSSYDERLQLRNNQSRQPIRPQKDPKKCAVCTKGLSSLFGKGVECGLCLNTVCSACHIKKEVACISRLGGDLMAQKIDFCVLCVTAVTQADAYVIARDEASQKYSTRGLGRSATSSQSSTSLADSIDEHGIAM